MAIASHIVFATGFLVEIMSEGAATLAADSTILDVSRRFLEMIGREPEPVVGSRLQAFVASGDLDRISSFLQQALAGSATSCVDLLRPDGATVPTSVAMRRLDADDAPGIAAVFTDLSDLRRAEAVRNLLAGIVEAVPSAKRIVARPGGRVWAEGEPNESATFYFALPTKETSHA